MPPKNKEELLEIELKVIKKIYPLGWIPKGNFMFERNGVLYDLSAADIKQLDRIERKKLFVVER